MLTSVPAGSGVNRLADDSTGPGEEDGMLRSLNCFSIQWNSILETTRAKGKRM